MNYSTLNHSTLNYSTLLTRLALGTLTLAALPVAGLAAVPTLYYPVNATINTDISGTALTGFASAYDLLKGAPATSPTVTLAKGAKVVSLNTWNASVVNITGGVVTVNIAAIQNSVVNITGGTPAPLITASNNSVINFYGTGLSSSLLTTLPTSSVYALSGALADGSSLKGVTLTLFGSKSSFAFKPSSVPEPGSVALLVGMGVSGLALVKRRRK